MATSPGDQAHDDGRMRASRADREHVVDALKAAFVQDRLTRDELDARVGQALVARTYADLAALTADLPAEPDASPAHAPAPAAKPAPARNAAAKTAVKVGASVIGGITVTVSGTVLVITGQPFAAMALMILIVIATVLAGALVAALIAVTVKLESHHRNRSRRRLPPRPTAGPGVQASGLAPGPDPKTHKAPKAPRRSPGQLAVGRAG